MAKWKLNTRRSMLWFQFTGNHVSESKIPIGYMHRPRKVFESGGQTGAMTKGGACAPAHSPRPCWKLVREGGRPSHNTGAGVTPRENFANFVCKLRRLGVKLHFVFIPSKLQFWPRRLVTDGSLKLRNGNLYSPYKFTVMHFTLNSLHTINHF